MQSTRQNKISRLIQKELSDIFQKAGQTIFHGKMITVTKVRVTSDLALARAYLSIFPTEGKDEVLKHVKDMSSQVRGELGPSNRYATSCYTQPGIFSLTTVWIILKTLTAC